MHELRGSEKCAQKRFGARLYTCGTFILVYMEYVDPLGKKLNVQSPNPLNPYTPKPLSTKPFTPKAHLEPPL